MIHEEPYLNLQLLVKDLGGVVFIFTLINGTVDASSDFVRNEAGLCGQILYMAN